MNQVLNTPRVPTLEHPLVIGISSSALFDMREADQIFRDKGSDYYEAFMEEREDEPFLPGLAFDMVARQAEINVKSGHDLVRITLLSRNSAWTGIRAVKSCEKYGLPFQNAVFGGGASPVPYLKAYDIGLFISSNLEDVKHAQEVKGIAAFQALGTLPELGQIEELKVQFNKADKVQAPKINLNAGIERRLHLVFDLDRVVFDHESDERFDPKNVTPYFEHEKKHSAISLGEGPFGPIANYFSTLASQFPQEQSPYKVSILTARGGDAALRALKSLRAMNIRMNGETHMMGGAMVQNGKLVAGTINPDKIRVLEVMRDEHPNDTLVFFDDSAATIGRTATLTGVLSGLVPRTSGQYRQRSLIVAG